MLLGLSGCSKETFEVESVSHIDPQGKQMRYYVDRVDDGKISMGGNGIESYREFKILHYYEGDDCHVVIADKTRIYIPKSDFIEIVLKKLKK